jgi:hypothetical protein
VLASWPTSGKELSSTLHTTPRRALAGRHHLPIPLLSSPRQSPKSQVTHAMPPAAVTMVSYL